MSIRSGTRGRDTLTGSDSVDTLLGFGGDDLLWAHAGHDLLHGGQGADTLIGGAGNDRLTGGTGVDLFLIDAGADAVLDFGLGADILQVGAGASVRVALAGDYIATSATFNDGTADFNARGFNVDLSAVTGGTYGFNISAGEASVLGGWSAAFAWLGAGGFGPSRGVRMRGSALDDTLSGGRGNDTLDGGAGDDSLSGGAGNDVFQIQSGRDTVTDLGARDVFHVAVGAHLEGHVVSALVAGPGSVNAGTVTLTTSGASVNLVLVSDPGSGTFEVRNTGRAAALTGFAGEDTLIAGASGDQLSGMGGDDDLRGGAGRDTLDGGDGDDRLQGAGGADRVRGGAGEDTFVLGPFDGPSGTASSTVFSASRDDIIVDFEQSKDLIDLTGLRDGPAFAWGADQSKADGVWFAHSGGHTFVYLDVLDADGVADLTLRLNGKIDLLRTDFLGVEGAGTVTVGGSVIDGYIAGAAIYVDIDADGIADPEENTGLVTDSLGNFSGTVSAAGTLIAVGGTNIDTGLPNLVPLSAPAGSTVVTPLTSLVVELQSLGLSASEAMASALTAFGLPSDLDLTTFDPLDPEADPEIALAVQQAAVQVVQAASLAGSPSAAIEAIAGAIGAMAPGATLDLGSPEQLAAILPSLDPATIAQIASINQTIQQTTSLESVSNAQGNAASAPAITSASSGSVSENSAAGTTVYSASAVDPQGDTVTFSLKGDGGTDDAELLTIHATSGVVTVNASPDYESRASYSFTVVASDGTLSTEKSVSIAVLDLNEHAPGFTSGTVGSVEENAATTTVIYTASATDTDGTAAQNTITYSLQSDGDASLLEINASTGQVTLKSSADSESQPSYSFTVVASDGTKQAQQPVTVSITDLNDNAPSVTSGTTGSVDENAVISTVIYTVAATDADVTAALNTVTYSLKSGADASLLDIDATTGQVTLKSSADYEVKASYSFTVVASDGALSAERLVTVNVTDLNDNTPGFTSGATDSSDVLVELVGVTATGLTTGTVSAGVILIG